MKRIFVLWAMLFIFSSAWCQTFITRNGFIGFYSKTEMEDIKAEHKQVYGVIDITNQRLAFTLLVKGFSFRKQLMQVHFNENYIESDKFPKASFAGNFTGSIPAQGVGNVMIKGVINLHGVNKQIEVPATLEMRNDQLIGKANFKLDPADFKIKIPSLVREKIAPLIDVVVSIECNATK